MSARVYDEPDAEVRDPADITQLYDLTLRQPALPLAERWPIVAGLDAGAPVDMIAGSLAAGWEWRTGPAANARGPAVVWLSPIDVPYEHQLAAWCVGGPI